MESRREFDTVVPIDAGEVVTELSTRYNSAKKKAKTTLISVHDFRLGRYGLQTWPPLPLLLHVHVHGHIDVHDDAEMGGW